MWYSIYEGKGWKEAIMLTEKKFLSQKELDRLTEILDKHPGRDATLIKLALFTGARSCEVLAVRKTDLGQNSVTIFGAKKSNDRTVPLPAGFFREISELCEALSDNDKIFQITTRQFRRIWNQYRPNYQLGIHSLRHTFGILLYNNCNNIHVVKTMLGHVSISSTQVYLSFVETQRVLRNMSKGMFSKRNIKNVI